MRVLMVTGDKRIFEQGSEAHARFLLQQGQVDALDAVFVGRGSWVPKIPEGHYDVVTAQDPFWRGLFAWRVARRRGARLNVQVHADLSAQSFVRHVLAQIVLRHADSVRVVSEKIKKQIGRMGIKTPISVLPVFIDVSRFKNLAPVAHDKKNILWIGRLEKEKDPEAALAVFKKVRDSGIDARFIFLGAGSLENALHTQAASFGNYIEFAGWQDTAPFLAKADVVLSTSPAESYGASIIEALAARVPVVAPDVGAAREAGAIVASREQLAEAVIHVLTKGVKGELKINMPDAQEYATLWRKSIEA